MQVEKQNTIWFKPSLDTGCKGVMMSSKQIMCLRITRAAREGDFFVAFFRVGFVSVCFGWNLMKMGDSPRFINMMETPSGKHT